MTTGARQAARRVLYSVLVVALACPLLACRRSRNVKLAWDVPSVLPDHYRVFVDTQMVQKMSPPPVDPSCKCFSVTIEVPRGEHLVHIDACNREGVCTPSADVAVR